MDAEVLASWVTADEAYGGDPALRSWLEDRAISYVLAVKYTHPCHYRVARHHDPAQGDLALVTQ